MEYYYSGNPVRNLLLFSALILLTGVLIVYIFLHSPPSFSLYPPNSSAPTTNLTSAEFNADPLDAALAETATTGNRTLIIAVVNRAYVEQDANSSEAITMLDLFLESFWLGEETRRLVDNLLVVAVDEAAYQRCRFKRLHCYRLLTDGVDYGSEKVYMSTDFINMMWTRTLFLLDVLKRGYNFVFTDSDVMWVRNPFPILNEDERMDLQISVDKFNGNATSEDNPINTGFYYIRSNSRTISLFDKWYSMKHNATGKKEQDVLLGLMRDGLFTSLGLRVRFLDTRYFSGFCEDSEDVTAVTTVHANCCRHINAKVKDLTAMLRNWKQFHQLTSGGAQNRTLPHVTHATKTHFQWSPHVGCANSWKGN